METSRVPRTRPPELALSFGKDLQQERETREVSLEAIAEGTKVSIRYLRALEAGDTEQMPGGVFNKGMVRSYCGYLGLDEAEWLARWASAQSENDPDFAEFAENVKRSRPDRGPNMRARWWGVLAIVTVLVGMAWAAWHFVVKPRMFGSDSLPLGVSRAGDPGLSPRQHWGFTLDV